MRRHVILALLAAVLIAGCGDSDSTPNTATAPAPAETPAPTPATDDPPLPQHLTFAPGETIAADKQAGIFFLDPKTGAAEAWVEPAATVAGNGPLPFTFTLGGFSADGSKVIYTCLEPADSGPPVPCGGAVDRTWYALDTHSGQRTRISAFTGAFLTISPDGQTLLGTTPDGVGLAEAPGAADVRQIPLPPGTDYAYPGVSWSPDSAHAILGVGNTTRHTFLINTTAAHSVDVDPAFVGASWSPDGTRVLFWKPIADGLGEFHMLSRDGDLLWTKRFESLGANASWSADGSLLYAEAQVTPITLDGYSPLNRIEILDSATGATSHRIAGGFCPIGWIGKTHRLLTDSYGFGEVLADLDAQNLQLLDTYVTPMPFDDNTAIQFNGEDFSSYDFATGATKLIAHTTVAPAWDANHGALFAGNRLVFTSLHGGHGGCGEGNGPKDPPRPSLLVGPFPDDAPVTRGQAR